MWRSNDREWASSEGRTITDSSLVEAVLSAAPTHMQVLTKQFLTLFGNRFQSLSKQMKESGRWIELSRFHNLSDEEVIEALNPESKVLRACRADDQTSFLAITIQTISYYSSQEGLNHLRECLKLSGVERAKLYQSSDDCALNLFIFLDQPTPSSEAASLLSRALRRHGIVPGTAGLKVFPSEEGFCLPLQPGFAWLNDDGQIIVTREQITLEAALALFFADFQKYRISTEGLIACLKAQVTSAPTNIKSIHDVDPAKLQMSAPAPTAGFGPAPAQPSQPAPTVPPPKNVSGDYSKNGPTNIVQWKSREKQTEDKELNTIDTKGEEPKTQDIKVEPQVEVEQVSIEDKTESATETIKKNTFETIVDTAFDAVADLNFQPTVERSLKTVIELLESAPDVVETAFEAAESAPTLETILEEASVNVAEEKTEAGAGAAEKLIAELKAEAESGESDEETAYSWMHRTASTLESDDFENDGDVLPKADSPVVEEESEDFTPVPTPNEYIKDFQQLRFFD